MSIIDFWEEEKSAGRQDLGQIQMDIGLSRRHQGDQKLSKRLSQDGREGDWEKRQWNVNIHAESKIHSI